jgi:hypothetical protein
MPGPKPAAGAAAAPESSNVTVLCFMAWLVPGGAHFLLAQTRKALIFFVVLSFMYILGLVFGGRLFPFDLTDPLVFLSALAQWSVGLLRLIGVVGGFGQGNVTAATYEYGNTFLIVAGLLNALVVLDAYDVATGRKPR